MERFVFQGFPALPAVADYAQLPWLAVLADLSEAEIRSLTGNAMHLAVLGAVAHPSCLLALPGPP